MFCKISLPQMEYILGQEFLKLCHRGGTTVPNETFLLEGEQAIWCQDIAIDQPPLFQKLSSDVVAQKAEFTLHDQVAILNSVTILDQLDQASNYQRTFSKATIFEGMGRCDLDFPTGESLHLLNAERFYRRYQGAPLLSQTPCLGVMSFQVQSLEEVEKFFFEKSINLLPVRGRRLVISPVVTGKVLWEFTD